MMMDLALRAMAVLAGFAVGAVAVALVRLQLRRKRSPSAVERLSELRRRGVISDVPSPN